MCGRRSGGGGRGGGHARPALAGARLRPVAASGACAGMGSTPAELAVHRGPGFPRVHGGVTVANTQKHPRRPPHTPLGPLLGPHETPTDTTDPVLGPATPHRLTQAPAGPSSLCLISVPGGRRCLFRDVTEVQGPGMGLRAAMSFPAALRLTARSLSRRWDSPMQTLSNACPPTRGGPLAGSSSEPSSTEPLEARVPAGWASVPGSPWGHATGTATRFPRRLQREAGPHGAARAPALPRPASGSAGSAPLTWAVLVGALGPPGVLVCTPPRRTVEHLSGGSTGGLCATGAEGGPGAGAGPSLRLGHRLAV